MGSTEQARRRAMSEATRKRLHDRRLRMRTEIQRAWTSRANGVNEMVRAGRARVGESDAKLLSDYLIWMVVTAVREESHLPEGPRRDAAAGAAESAATRWLKSHASEVTLVTALGQVNRLLISPHVDRLLGAAIDAFCESLEVGSAT